VENLGEIQFFLAQSREPRKTFAMRIVPAVPKRHRQAETIAFTRSELTRILGVYGQFVAAGDWRDYAIDCLDDVAVFSIFRRASEMPLYRIEKRPKLARKQGAYLIVSMSGAILKRGNDLGQVLRVLDRSIAKN